MHSSRRELLRSVGLFGAAFVVSRGLAGCFETSTDESSGHGEDALSTCELPTISRNHGHALVVSSEDVAAGLTKTYSIKGSSTHDHEVTITADQFAALAAGTTLTLTTTTVGGHSHSVTVSCSAVTADAGSDGSHDAGNADASDAGHACSGGARGAISANHGHALEVPKADVASGQAKSYSIKGSSGHAHDVTVTAAQFEALKSARSITVTSTSGAGHTHTVTITCA